MISLETPDVLEGGFVLAHLGADELPTVLVVAGVLVAAGMLVSAVTRRSSGTRGGGTRPVAVNALVWVAVAGIGFQVLHFAEHLLQAGYWVLHPVEAPWLTPWAGVGRDVLASATDGQAATGNELLHLGGNAVFFAGLVAALLAVRSSARWTRTPSGLRGALWAQGFHVALHVGLTVTWLTLQQAHGLSTLFGLLEPGTVAANAMRVWVHFTINLVATVYAVIGLWQIRGMLPGRSDPRPVALPRMAGVEATDEAQGDAGVAGDAQDAGDSVEADKVPAGRP